MQLLGILFAWWHFLIRSLSSHNTDALFCLSRPRFVLGVEGRVRSYILCGSSCLTATEFPSFYFMCREKATLKGEFSNKALTETLVLRV